MTSVNWGPLIRSWACEELSRPERSILYRVRGTTTHRRDHIGVDVSHLRVESVKMPSDGMLAGELRFLKSQVSLVSEKAGGES